MRESSDMCTEYPGGQDVLPPALPRPTRAFVMRKEPWEFIEKAMFDVRNFKDTEEPRMLVVTGMGGCGKTQLILKFAQVHKNKSVMFPILVCCLRRSKIRSNTLY